MPSHLAGREEERVLHRDAEPDVVARVKLVKQANPIALPSRAASCASIGDPGLMPPSIVEVVV
jgi:hypothetical protein